MDRKQIISYLSESESYLEKKGVYQLFDSLLKQLVINQPDDPIQFLIQQIQRPEGKKIFLFGPPGGNSEHLCQFLGRQQNIEIIQAGKIIEQEALKAEKSQEQIKKFTNISDNNALEIMQDTMNKIDLKSKTLIIEGFPKTRIQALEWQKQGIIPEAVIIVQMNKEKIIQNCLAKIQSGKYEHIRKQDQETLAINYAEEYILNLQQVKELFQNIYEIEEGSSQSQSEEQISKLIQYKIYNQIPKTEAKIFIQGMPGSRKTKFAKSIAKKYGIVYISINEILANQIRNKTAVGRRVLQDIQNNELVPDEIIIGLLHRRLQQTDCQISGYIVDGFPKTQAQLNSIKELKIQVAKMFILELDTTDAFERIQGSKIDPKTGIIYDRKGLAELSNEEIKSRLYEIQNTTEEQISERIKRWKAISKNIKETFDKDAIEINALLPEESIKAKIFDVLDLK